jgi:hypothetical protein
MFVSKAGAYPNEVALRGFTIGYPHDLIRKHKTRVERPSRAQTLADFGHLYKLRRKLYIQ